VKAQLPKAEIFCSNHQKKTTLELFFFLLLLETLPFSLFFWCVSKLLNLVNLGDFVFFFPQVKNTQALANAL
jgi:hypothetical protein